MQRLVFSLALSFNTITQPLFLFCAAKQPLEEFKEIMTAQKEGKKLMILQLVDP